MQMIAAFLVAVIVYFTDLSTAQISSGYATYSNSDGGVCSGVSSSLPAVAMNAAQFANGAACGQCVQITGTGNGAGKDPVSTAPYLAVINNVCPQCNYGDIDLQGSGDGKFGVQWSFVTCPGAGRKLIEEPFQGDSTVYTMGEQKQEASETISAATPESGVPEAAEPQAETTTEGAQAPEAKITNSEDERSPQDLTLKIEDVEASVSDINQESSEAEASEGTADISTEPAQTQKASRRLLRAAQ